MRTRKLVTACALGVLAGPVSMPTPRTSSAPSADAVLDAMFQSIGGREAWRALGSVQFNFVSTSTPFGQDEWPGAPTAFNWLDGTEHRDYARPGLWTRYHLPNVKPTLMRAFLRDSAGIMLDTLRSGFGGPAPREGYGLVWRNDPIRLLRAAAVSDARARLLPAGVHAGRKCTGIATALPEDTVSFWIDAVTHEPVEIERDEDNAVFGRQVTRIDVGDWVKTSELRLPLIFTVATNGTLTQTMQLAQPRVNVRGDSLFALVKMSPAGGGAPPQPPHIVELAPSIYRVEATSANVAYNVLFAQVGDSIILVDPPIDDRYTNTVLDSIRRRFPNTPPRAFVATHHHSDHLGGARAAFAAGLSAITSSANADYVRHVGQASAKVAAGRRVTSVGDSLAVGSGPGRMVIYQIPNSHARGLVMAYFPEPKLLAEVDLALGPPQDRRDLYDFLTSRGVQVDKLARMHGSVMAWEQFVKTVPGLPPPK